MRILNTIGPAFTSEGKKILAGLGEVDYKVPTQAELGRIIGRYDVALIGLGLNFDKNILSAATKLKVIATATTGLDHIDVTTAKEKGIEVLSLRGEDEFLNTITGTAELALCLMIELARRTPQAFEAVKRYEWKRDNFKGVSMQGKTLGVVGLGRLGGMLARYGEALSMKVLFADPGAKNAKPAWKKVSLENLLAESDFVSINVHLLPETENLFNKQSLGLMKPTAFLINTARGKIVDEAAVLESLESKKMAGYATDVLADELSFEEKGFEKHPLVEYAKTHDNCIIVPHIGGMTIDSRIATDVFMAKKLREYFLQDQTL